jgi:hypothetical protein
MLYLTEDNLSLLLINLYPNHVFIRNKQIPNFEYKWRPDFRNDELMLIIEFDGYLHYTKTDIVKKYLLKDIAYKKLGYKVIRIPYFIQLNTIFIKLLFDKDYDYNQIYPHGFIADKAILPYDFCYFGLCKYKDDLLKFHFCKNEIESSIKEKEIYDTVLNSII